MEDYEYIKFLGQGSYGEVQLVKHVLEEKEYVLKKIGLQKASPKEIFSAEQEAALLSQLKHINIVSYKESFQIRGTLYIVMQHCEGGDLHSWLANRKGKHLEELQIILWFVQIALALQYLHGKNILHRDIKTQNIFLTHKNEIVKLGDLGIARQLSGTQDMARTIIGTPYYMSPELFSNRPYNFKSDVWSLGCVVYEMCTMKHAFRARDFSGLAYKICTGKVPPLPNKYTTELSCLVTSMLEQEAEDRPTVSEILHLKFIRSYIQIFIKRNRDPGKLKIVPRARSDSTADVKTEPIKARPLRANSLDSAPSTEAARSDHCPHIRQQCNRNTADKAVRQNNEEGEGANRQPSKRLSNSHHLALVPSVIDLLRKDESKSSDNRDPGFARGEPNRRSSKDLAKIADSDCNTSDPPIAPQISSARKRRIEDKRKRSRSTDRISPDIFSSSSSDPPSPTLDSGARSASPRVPSPVVFTSRPSSPAVPTSRPSSPGFPPRVPSPGLPPRSKSPGLPPKSKSPALPRNPASKPLKTSSSRPPSPCLSRPASPSETKQVLNDPRVDDKFPSRPASPAQRSPSPGLAPSPQLKKKVSGGKSKYRPLPPTPPSSNLPSDRPPRRKTKSQSEEVKAPDQIRDFMSISEPRPLPASPREKYQSLTGEREQLVEKDRKVPGSPEEDTPQISRMKNRLERLRSQVLPCVSRDVLEKAYRVLDESDPEKVQSKLMLLVGNSPPGLCNKVMELYITQQRTKHKQSLFQSI